jgi:hypothetical protein
MGVVERAVHVEVHVVAVRDRRVPGADVRPAAGALHRRAGRRPAPVHVEAMLVGVLIVRRVQMAVVQVIGVVAVLDGLVAAALAVPVGVTLVLLAAHGPIVSLHEHAVNRGIIT